MKLRNPNWISVDVQVRIDPTPIPLNRALTENVKECDIIMTKIYWDPTSAMSETYKLKNAMSKNGKQEEFLKMIITSRLQSTGLELQPHPEESMIYLPYYMQNPYGNSTRWQSKS